MKNIDITEITTSPVQLIGKQWMLITAGGLQESHPHDVTITQDPGNYSR